MMDEKFIQLLQAMLSKMDEYAATFPEKVNYDVKEAGKIARVMSIFNSLLRGIGTIEIDKGGKHSLKIVTDDYHAFLTAKIVEVVK